MSLSKMILTGSLEDDFGKLHEINKIIATGTKSLIIIFKSFIRPGQSLQSRVIQKFNGNLEKIKSFSR